MHSFRSAARMCRRPSCQGPASVTLSFSYETAEVLLFDLVEERHPSRWDLCRTHADTLGVPRGWNLIDDRQGATRTATAEESPPPAPRSSVPAGPAVTPPGDSTLSQGSSRRNRYAELSARLPELAGRHGQTARADARTGGNAAGTDQPSGGNGSTGAYGDAAPSPDMPVVDEDIPGQLSMTLPETAGDGDAVWGYAGNVVPLLRRESVLGSVT